ncbi:MAG: relaxase/mobilization nuclease, partial [Oscillospiraceae bacterium]|nr:relaxase/mobilization nuclease [Oscillospiraceae bacterium]
EQNGKPTWRTAIRMDIREAISESFSWRQFIACMEQKGYVWKLDRKYISLRAPGMERFVRLKSLGKNYSEDVLKKWILQPKTKNDRSAGSGNGRGKKKLHGLQALYYSYLYQMGVLKRKPRNVPYAVRQDIRRLDERIAQMEFLQKHNITTREELSAYRKPLEEQVVSLTKERQRLYRTDPQSEHICEINNILKPLRKEIRMCVKIAQHSQEMEQRMKEAEHLLTESEKQKVRQQVDSQCYSVEQR